MSKSGKRVTNNNQAANDKPREPRPRPISQPASEGYPTLALAFIKAGYEIRGK